MTGIYLFSIFLLTAAWQDAWKKEIPIWIFWIGGTAAMGLFGWQLANRMLYGMEAEWLKLCTDFVAGSIPGISLLFCGKMADGAVGSGDGWFFLVSGWFLGLENTVLLLCGATFLCGCWALGLLCWKQVWCNENVGKRTLPFLPFAALAWLGMAVSGWII